MGPRVTIMLIMKCWGVELAVLDLLGMYLILVVVLALDVVSSCPV